MKKAIHLLLTALILNVLLFGAGCKKDNNKKDADQDPAGKYSFSNSEYTGIAQVGNHYFPRPLSLRFGAGDDVSAWSHFTLNQWVRGEIPGKITKVEENAQGQTEITVLFEFPGKEPLNSPQVFIVSADKLTITGGSTPIISLVDMKLYPKKSYNIVSEWALPEHPQWFPDINRIKFYPSGQTQYVQYGKPVMYSYDANIPWKENYKQDGSRITFAGVNPSQEPYSIIPYYGVISADGDTLYVDAYSFTGSRLPSIFSDYNPYGPAKVTPWLIRQKANP
jgi:hypothetical protein